MPDLLPGFGVERSILKVHELTSEIRGLLEASFSDFWVEGEISNPRMPGSGHLYFTLKDRKSQIRGIIFKSHMRFLRFIPKEGQSVLIRAHLSLYEPRGEYQLICDYLEPMGTGALLAAFEALKQKLENEGLFHADLKKVMPLRPSRIGVITSPSGAAIQDILKVIRESRFPCQTLIYPVAVQGKNAAREIINGLDDLNHYSKQGNAQALDLLILARGGGSFEDLSPFNQEDVARSISKSLIPIISAIGHETDTTISDHVADLRAPTPSIAAEIVSKTGGASIDKVLDLRETLLDRMTMILRDKRGRIDFSLRLLVAPQQMKFLGEQVNHLVSRLRSAMDRSIEGQKNRLKTSEGALSHLSPIDRLRELRSIQEDLDKRLIQEVRREIGRKKNRFQAVMEQLNLLSPLNILGRGYSITRLLPTLGVIHDVAEISKGDCLQIRLHRGKLNCRVEDKNIC